MHRPKFDSQFSERQIYGLYAWLGSVGNPDELKPLLRFLSKLDELRQEQMWGTVPNPKWFPLKGSIMVSTTHMHIGHMLSHSCNGAAVLIWDTLGRLLALR